jgi:hypothetical protein
MDITIWRFIQWESDEIEIFCEGCFASVMIPKILYYHYPDTTWHKTRNGSFRIIGLAMERLCGRKNSRTTDRCSNCMKSRSNHLYGKLVCP